MQVCVLGATGFIGDHIARQCVQAGWNVQALRRNPQATGNIPDISITWFTGDLSEHESLLRAMSGCEIVFHAAAYYPHQTGNVAAQVASAVAEMQSVLAAAAECSVKRMVFTSSLTTIGLPAEIGLLADERDFYTPGTLAASAYYEAKYAMEQLAFHAAPTGLDVVVLNPTAVFGPGDVKPTTGRILIALAKGYGRVLIEGETNVIDVREVATAHIEAAKVGQAGERYIIGGHNLTMRTALETVAEVAGVRPPRFRVPLPLLGALAGLAKVFPMLGLPVNHLHAIRNWQPLASQKADMAFGLNHWPFKETVSDSLTWFSTQKYV